MAFSLHLVYAARKSWPNSIAFKQLLCQRPSDETQHLQLAEPSQLWEALSEIETGIEVGVESHISRYHQAHGRLVWSGRVNRGSPATLQKPLSARGVDPLHLG